MYKELILNLTNEAKFSIPVDSAMISHAETALAVTLPEDLINILYETNVVKGSDPFYLA